MPYITVFGMPDSVTQGNLQCLAGSIRLAVAHVPVLDIPEEEVFVFFPPDLMKYELGEELGAKIDGLFIKPERTTEVLQSMLRVVRTCLEDFALRELPTCSTVEAFIGSMVPAELCDIQDDVPGLRCPACAGRGDGGGDKRCSMCGGSGRKADA